MKKLLVVLIVLSSMICKSQNRELYHFVDLSFGTSMPLGSFKNGTIENLTGGNALGGIAANVAFHVEVTELFGVVFKYGYQQNKLSMDRVRDYFSSIGDVNIYGGDSWRLNHLALGGQVVTPVGGIMNADFYALIGLEWGYVPSFEMTYHGAYSIEDYYNYSPFVCPAGILGGDLRIRMVSGISFLINSEFMFCKPTIEYYEIYSSTNSTKNTPPLSSSLSLQSISLSGGISVDF